MLFGGQRMKLIAIDMDGTLLSSDGTISNVNRDAIKEVQKEGNLVTICSGRSILDILEILQKSNIEASVIGGNGAVIYHKQYLKMLSLSLNLLYELIDMVESEGLYYEIYTNRGIVVQESNKDILYREVEEVLAYDYTTNHQYYEHKIGIQFNQHHLMNVPSIKDLDFLVLQPYKIYAFSFIKEKRDRFQAAIKSRKDISITTGGTETIEIGHPEASKGFGLAYLANYFCIPLEKTIAIGDNLNDISMFQISGVSVAMGNAIEEVKQKAMYVTTNCDEDGVANALQKYIIKNKNNEKISDS